MKKQLTALILVGWALLSLCYIAGEPIEPMGFGEFVLCKLIGFASLGASIWVISRAERGGYMPDDDVEDQSWEE